MDRIPVDGDDLFLAILHPEEERGKSSAVAKAALVAEKWLAAKSGSLSARAREILQTLPAEASAGKMRFHHE